VEGFHVSARTERAEAQAAASAREGGSTKRNPPGSAAHRCDVHSRALRRPPATDESSAAMGGAGPAADTTSTASRSDSDASGTAIRLARSDAGTRVWKWSAVKGAVARRAAAEVRSEPRSTPAAADRPRGLRATAGTRDRRAASSPKVAA
jgi:hypothetical protein